MSRDQPGTFKIYAVTRKRDGLILYVGRTRQRLEKRLKLHTCHAFRNQKKDTKWRRWLRGNRLEQLDIIELQSGIGSDAFASKKELETIKELEESGVILYNTSGSVRNSILRCKNNYARQKYVKAKPKSDFSLVSAAKEITRSMRILFY